MFDRYGTAITIATLACLAALAVTVARDKPFWHDEVFTVLISQMPFATIYRASADAIDLAPPLNTALTRVVHGVGGVGSVATRLDVRMPDLSGVRVSCHGCARDAAATGGGP